MDEPETCSGLRYPEEQRLVHRPMLPDRSQDFQPESHASGSIAAIGVLARVDTGGQKAGDQVPMPAVDLENIEASRSCTGRRVTESGNDLLDFREGAAGMGKWLGATAGLVDELVDRGWLTPAGPHGGYMAYSFVQPVMHFGGARRG